MIFDLTSLSIYNLSSYDSVEIIGLILILAIAIDLVLGEFPISIHPVVIIGKIIDFFEKYFINVKNKVAGVYLTISVTLISFSLAILILWISSINFFLFIIVSTLLLSSMFSFKFLLLSANDIKNDLLKDIDKARKSMSFLVSRKTGELSEKLIISATIETLTENITDSCVSVFFYYLLSVILGLFLVILFNFLNLNNNLLLFVNQNLFYIIAIFSILLSIFFRTINTLDAMVGYKNQKYLLIGWFPAKLDDLLNYIPSRFSGLMVVISAFFLRFKWKNSYFILKRDKNKCPSPNSAYTMAAAAGALNIQLRKENVYKIGDKNEDLATSHIDKAIKLSRISILLSIIILLLLFYSCLYFLFIFF